MGCRSLSVCFSILQGGWLGRGLIGGGDGGRAAKLTLRDQGAPGSVSASVEFGLEQERFIDTGCVPSVIVTELTLASVM